MKFLEAEFKKALEKEKLRGRGRLRVWGDVKAYSDIVLPYGSGVRREGRERDGREK
jgi:hypothetical protein